LFTPAARNREWRANPTNGKILSGRGKRSVSSSLSNLFVTAAFDEVQPQRYPSRCRQELDEHATQEKSGKSEVWNEA
jgi:hypothetical protein